MSAERGPPPPPPDRATGVDPDPSRAAPAASQTGTNRFLYILLVTIGVNTVIAGLVSLVQTTPFTPTLRTAQIIGISIFLFSWTAKRLVPGHGWRLSAVAILLGAVFGVAVGRLFDWRLHGQPLVASPRLVTISLAVSITFGIVVSYYFRSRAALAEEKARLHDERARRAEDARRVTEVELKLLQAQIEPHFLFNTLSNILQLVDSNSPGAKQMLLNLTSYLRGSLRRTRAGDTSLGEEIDLLRAYLEIQSVRMGDRLRYVIECPSELRDLALPPLLLQPLVENSVRHGLEPSSDGGEVRVEATRQEDKLVLEVRDTGLGLASGSKSGVGLANVRTRVSSISGGRGKLVIQPNAPRGLRIRIELPWPEQLPAGTSDPRRPTTA
jgi:hypothetical protein